MNTNKTFDIMVFLEGRPLSWSAISSFEWSPEQWYQTYFKGIRQSSPEMTFGSKVDSRIQKDPKFLPSLRRYKYMQHKMKVSYAGIPLVGIPDGLEMEITKELADYKTGVKPWDQARADETGQLTFYLFLLYISYRHKPEDYRCRIHWLPTVKTENGNFDVVIEFVPDIDSNIKTFETKRTMVDLLAFGERIKKTVAAMQEYVRNHD